MRDVSNAIVFTLALKLAFIVLQIPTHEMSVFAMPPYVIRKYCIYSLLITLQVVLHMESASSIVQGTF